ncbi:winged helix-turn-helix transcriptional regulator [Algicella marina]
MLVKLTTRAWSLRILALMHRGTPGRQATLLAACGAGRTSFSHSLAHLEKLRLLERNPGHGHPLRPEFRLTTEGAAMARLADRIEAASPGTEEAALLRRAWTVPVLAVSREPRHFSQIKGQLGGITDRALSQSLKTLTAADWLERWVNPAGHPPRPVYRAANAGAEISRAVLRVTG